MKYLITYDIEDDKTRKKVSDELEYYGVRVNYSVFECELKKFEIKKLLLKLEELFDKKNDSIRFYHICMNCLPKSFELGKNPDIFESEELFI